jgi:transcriptional repressor NrdR
MLLYRQLFSIPFKLIFSSKAFFFTYLQNYAILSGLNEKQSSSLDQRQHAMKCPYCGFLKDRVVDSRESRDGDSIRRRRQCLNCARRFTSYERSDEIPYMVVKKDGGRERFDRNKILNGLLKACEKRPVSLTQLEKIVDKVEQTVQESPERELESVNIGKILLSEIRRIDKVAYLRFASVYLEFEDVAEFMREINDLFEKKQ